MYEDTYKLVRVLLDANLAIHYADPILAGMSINEMLEATERLSRSSVYSALVDNEAAEKYGIVRTNSNRRNKRWTTDKNPIISGVSVTSVSDATTRPGEEPIEYGIEIVERISRLTEVRTQWLPQYRTNEEMLNDWAAHAINDTPLKEK